jgi:hypothetical protein
MGSKRVVRSSIGSQLRISSPDSLPNLDKIGVSEKERLLDDKIEQFAKIHAIDLANNILLIGPVKTHRQGSSDLSDAECVPAWVRQTLPIPINHSDDRQLNVTT